MPLGDDDGEEEKRSEVICTEKEKGKRRMIFYGYRDGFLRGLLSSSSSSSAPSRLCSGKRNLGGGFCCFAQPRVLESDSKEAHADPNVPQALRFQHLKSIIENNDFYSEECNTHVAD